MIAYSGVVDELTAVVAMEVPHGKGRAAKVRRRALLRRE
jgi:hypothetical protein